LLFILRFGRKYEDPAIQGLWKNSHQLVVGTEKISHPELETVPSKWDFSLISEGLRNLLGIGHLLP